jgi:hypothetical protein
MSRRGRVYVHLLVPAAVAGLSLALSFEDVAGAKDSPGRTDSTATAPPKPAPRRTPKGNKHRTAPAPRRVHGPHPTLAIALGGRNWTDFEENQLRAPIAGANCPSEMSNVDDRFCIDKWEASLVEVLADGREAPWPPFGVVDESHSLRAASVPRVIPQAYISGAQAARACAAAGKRLCAPLEWRKACMGPEETTFGYGNDRIAGRCNDSGRSPMLRLFPQVAVSWRLVGMTEMNDPRLNQLEATLAPTGSHDGCTNGYGVFDMVGNLHEWTSDPKGTFQGGYYLDTHINGDGCTYRTVAHEFTYHDYSTGFRCCADPVMP